MKSVTITYHGHACFTLEAEGYRTVLDPYQDGMVAGLPALSLEAEAVFCSHGHGDHSYTQAVTLTQTCREAPYRVESIETPHDDQGGVLRGMNWVRIFDFDGLKIAHLGDLGEVPSGETLEKLKKVDALLIPVGGFYTIDPAAAAETVALIDPTVTVPMHYRTDHVGFDVLHHLNDFISKFQTVNFCDNVAVLTKETQKQVLVINYKP